MKRVLVVVVASFLVMLCLTPVTALAGGGPDCAEGYYPPLASADTYVLEEGTSLNVAAPGVLENDQSRRTDSPGLIVTNWWIGYPDHNHQSWVTHGSDGSFTFAPPTDFSGYVDYYVVVADQDSQDCDAAALARFVVNSVGNEPPIAQNDYLVVDEDGTGAVDVIDNDVDPEGSLLGVASVTGGDNGTCAVGGSFTISYTPNPDYNGSDSCIVSVSDGVNTSTSTLYIYTRPANDPPAAQDDVLDVGKIGTGTVDVIVNDTDPDGDTITVESVTDGQNGTCTVEANEVRYTSTTNFDGNDSCIVTISDGNGGTATSTLNITVDTVNDPPVAQDDVLDVSEDGTGTINVTANDADSEGGPLDVASVTGGDNGNCTVEANRVRYTPNSNFNGTDSCIVTISDGTDTATSTLNITVNAVNDPPVANFTVSGGVLSTSANGSSSADVDGGSLTYTWNFSDGTGYQSGGVTVDHQFRLPGNYGVILTVTDENGASSTLRQTVDILPNTLRVAEVNMSTNEGRKNANHVVNVVVSLAQPSLLPITFNYATANGSATAGSDYYAASGSKTILAGQTSVSIPVTIIGDNRLEADEKFTLSISSPNYGVVLGSPTTTATVGNDD